jgi:hypothetical protein
MRSYLCSYVHGRNKERKEKLFSPHTQEITTLESDPVSATSMLRLGEKSLVFAPIPVNAPPGTSKQVIYWPAIVLVRGYSKFL